MQKKCVRKPHSIKNLIYNKMTWVPVEAYIKTTLSRLSSAEALKWIFFPGLIHFPCSNWFIDSIKNTEVKSVSSFLTWIWCYFWHNLNLFCGNMLQIISPLIAQPAFTCSKLTIETLEQGHHWRHFGVFIVNVEHISYLALVFLLLTLNM